MSDPMKKILVIGGGIGGLTTAIALQQKGFDAHVYESAAELQPIGKGIWVPTNAMLVLERLGLADAVVHSGVPLERIELRDKADGILLSLNLREVETKYGHTTVSIHRATLQRRLVERTPEDEIIRSDLYDFPPIKRWWQGRVVLLGDAAHAMTPNLGQGGAQAIEDAFVLADTLSRRETTGEAFREYERLRMPKVRRIVNTAWQFGRVAHIRRRGLQRLRNLAMKSIPDWVNRKRVEWIYELNY